MKRKVLTGIGWYFLSRNVRCLGFKPFYANFCRLSISISLSSSLYLNFALLGLKTLSFSSRLHTCMGFNMKYTNYIQYIYIIYKVHDTLQKDYIFIKRKSCDIHMWFDTHCPPTMYIYLNEALYFFLVDSIIRPFIYFQ